MCFSGLKLWLENLVHGTALLIKFNNKVRLLSVLEKMSGHYTQAELFYVIKTEYLIFVT